MNNFLCVASWNTSVFEGAFRLMTDDGLRITAEVGIERIAGAPSLEAFRSFITAIVTCACGSRPRRGQISITTSPPLSKRPRRGRRACNKKTCDRHRKIHFLWFRKQRHAEHFNFRRINDSNCRHHPNTRKARTSS